MSSPDGRDTDFIIRPPLTHLGHDALLHNVGLESSVGELLVAGAIEKDEFQKHTVEGVPSDEHLALGIELAEAIMTLRGLKAASVVSEIEGKLETRIILSKDKVNQSSE